MKSMSIFNIIILQLKSCIKNFHVTIITPLCFGTLGWICNQVCKPIGRDGQGQWQDNTSTVVRYKQLARLFPFSNPWMYLLRNCNGAFPLLQPAIKKVLLQHSSHINNITICSGSPFLENQNPKKQNISVHQTFSHNVS